VEPDREGRQHAAAGDRHHARGRGPGPLQEVLRRRPRLPDRPGLSQLRLVRPGDGSSSLALYQREAAAQEAGVSSEGSGFRGVSFHYIVPSSEAVDEVMANATAAGGEVVKEAAGAQWGGYFGYFSDPDGHLWKVASTS
jgi:predicted enzyme related to lactoylglutathione lyase